MADYKLDDPAYAAVLKATVYLLLHEPFFGQLVSRLDVELLDEDCDWCQTAATDGTKLYFNRAFVLGCSSSELVFVCGHEVLHCLYDHLGRRQGRDPQVWNIANDYVVNYTLKNHKLGTMRAGWLYDDRFTDEMSSEEIYAILMKNSTTIEMELGQFDTHLDMAANDDDDDGDQQGQSGGNGDDEDGEGQGGQGKKPGQGDGDGDGDGQDGQGKGGGSGQGGKKVTMRVTGKNGPPKLSREELDEVRNRLRAAAIQAMQTAGSGAGNIPAGVLRRLGDLLEPKMDWRALLDSHIRSAVKDDYTFQHISRRDGMTGIILPAQDVLEVVEVDVAVDTSGSMSEPMLRDIFSEVKGIMQSFPDFKLRVWTFDTQVYGFKEFSPHNIDEIDEYAAKAQGGGGTMFECNWEFMRQNEITPHRLVLFTDGYPCGSWGDPNYCDTLFVIHGDQSKKIKSPFGQSCHYEDKGSNVQGERKAA